MGEYKFKAGDVLVHKSKYRQWKLLIHGPGKDDINYTYSWSDSPEVINDNGEKKVIEADFRLLTKLEKALN